MGPRAGLDRRKISPPPGFDRGPSSPYSVAIPTELLFPISVALNKVKLKVTLEEATKVQRWSRGLVLLFL